MKVEKKLEMVRDNMDLPVPELAKLIGISKNYVHYLKYLIRSDPGEVENGNFNVDENECWITGFKPYMAEKEKS